MGAVVSFQGGRPPALFSQRKSSLNAAAQANIQASFGVIGYKGRNWRVKFRGEETLLKDDRGVPVPNLDVIIVGVAAGISKQYYEKKFSEGDDAAPDCFSVNGVAPDASSPRKQCSTCAVCPKNQWGSRITEAGKKAKACQDSRRLAVVPLGDPENETYGGPMLLRIPPTSLSNLANYAGMLERKGASLEFVGTRLGFNYDVAYPQITFDATGWLDDEQARMVVGADGAGGIMADPVIERMLEEAVVEVSHDPVAAAPADPLAQGAPAAAFRPVAAAPVQAAPEPPVQEQVVQEQPAEPAPSKRRASPFQAASTPVDPPPAPTAAPKPVAKPAPVAATTVVAQAPNDLQAAIDDLLSAPIT